MKGSVTHRFGFRNVDASVMLQWCFSDGSMELFERKTIYGSYGALCQSVWPSKSWSAATSFAWRWENLDLVSSYSSLWIQYPRVEYLRFWPSKRMDSLLNHGFLQVFHNKGHEISHLVVACRSHFEYTRRPGKRACWCHLAWKRLGCQLKRPSLTNHESPNQDFNLNISTGDASRNRHFVASFISYYVVRRELE